MEWRGTLLAAVAPALLLAVAARQAILAKSYGLSPWKGGGFGMFSTVDAPSARFLRIYLVASDSAPRPVILPLALEEEGRRVRTMPAPASVSGIATRLARGPWVPLRLQSALESFRRLGGRGAPQPGDDEFTGRANFGPLPAGHVPDLELGLFRMLEPGENANPRLAPLRFDSVRVEVWRFDFDRETPALRSSLLLTAIVPGDSAPP